MTSAAGSVPVRAWTLSSRFSPLLLWLLLSGLCGTQADIPFPKDQNMDVEFPPRGRRSDSGLPDGHLRPLGYQRKSDGRVLEVEGEPSPQEVWARCAEPGEPCFMPGGLPPESCPECVAWSRDKELREAFGDLQVEVDKRRSRRVAQHVLPLRRFLSAFHAEEWQLRSLLPDEMRRHVRVPSGLHCGPLRQWMQGAVLTLSSGRMNQPVRALHDHQLTCAMDGRMDYIVIPPRFQGAFDLEWSQLELEGATSPLDVEMVNVFAHQEAARASWRWATLRSGSCIFVPAGHLFQVTSYGRALTITFLMAPVPSPSGVSDCEHRVPGRGLPSLSEMTAPTWTLARGGLRRPLRDHGLDPAGLRRDLLAAMRAEAALDSTTFARFFRAAALPEAPREPGEAFVRLLGGAGVGDGHLSRSDVEALSVGRLRALSADLGHDAAAGHHLDHDEL
ncbi:uncharacterized protein LOC116946579 [Petromyzon marinus]|uniref:Uncharacterized protein LOC116946579 n=1 Tax=Petromyzon marinus TaxID=7757 RepID=A0AAJ7X166_PETMA|nr:uncharacterized protein LOC116946579 [Petromyzon marinus]